MEFIRTKEMKVSVLKDQERMLSPKDKIKEYIKQEGNMAFDIINDDIAIGFALFRQINEGCYFLWDYAIDADYQNKHYGTKALRELIQFLKAEYNMHTLTTT